MKIRSIAFAVLALAFTQYACNQQAEEKEAAGAAEITTELINNPNTAQEEAVDPETAPVIQFENEVYEFGQITQGEKVQHSFTFTNSGKSNLIIASASGSCGCTVPSWPKEPIAPGETGQIDVVFDSNGKQGKQNKTVTLVANTVPNKTVIALKGEVLVPEKQ
jgi:hypothetical protein